MKFTNKLFFNKILKTLSPALFLEKEKGRKYSLGFEGAAELEATEATILCP